LKKLKNPNQKKASKEKKSI